MPSRSSSVYCAVDVLREEARVHEELNGSGGFGQHVRSVEGHDRLACAGRAGDEVRAFEGQVVDRILLLGQLLVRGQLHPAAPRRRPLRRGRAASEGILGRSLSRRPSVRSRRALRGHSWSPVGDAQAWHAPRFMPPNPCPPLSAHIGSAEHQLRGLEASRIVRRAAEARPVVPGRPASLRHRLPPCKGEFRPGASCSSSSLGVESLTNRRRGVSTFECELSYQQMGEGVEEYEPRSCLRESGAQEVFGFVLARSIAAARSDLRILLPALKLGLV